MSRQISLSLDLEWSDTDRNTCRADKWQFSAETTQILPSALSFLRPNYSTFPLTKLPGIFPITFCLS